MTKPYRLYSLLVSMYSGKVRGYLNYKQIGYVDKSVNLYELAYKIRSKTGERVVPVVRTPEGEWLQDSTLIIEELERRHPEPPITVHTPVQYLVSLLLECWADEYWLPIAMHYRWSYPDENRAFFVGDVGRSLAPIAPAVVQRRLGNRVAKRLADAAPVIGFVPAQHALLEAWTERTLDLLETHFRQHNYLLGGRPTIADYALLASFFGHLNRDPAPKRILMAGRPGLSAWAERTHSGAAAAGQLVAGDAIPPTLMPILDLVGAEFLPMVAAYQGALLAHVDLHRLGPGDQIPRIVGEVAFPMGAGTFRRRAMPYTLWMMQRLHDKLCERTAADRRTMNDWLGRAFGIGIADLGPGPRLNRHGLSTTLSR